MSLYRSPHDPFAACSIIRVHTFLELAVRDLIVWRELKELTNFVGDPDPVGDGIKLPHPELRGFGGKRNAFLELMERSLLSKQVCDIHTWADVASKRAVRVITGHSVIRNPAIFAVISSEPVLHDERFARVECFRVCLEALLQIVRIHALGPAISHLLFQTAARKLQPAFVEKSAQFVDSGHPDKNWGGVSNYSETLLAFAQSRLTRLQPPIKPSSANEVVAQLVGHRGHEN